jgi:hypothetical protein
MRVFWGPRTGRGFQGTRLEGLEEFDVRRRDEALVWMEACTVMIDASRRTAKTSNALNRRRVDENFKPLSTHGGVRQVTVARRTG